MLRHNYWVTLIWVRLKAKQITSNTDYLLFRSVWYKWFITDLCNRRYRYRNMKMNKYQCCNYDNYDWMISLWYAFRLFSKYNNYDREPNNLFLYWWKQYVNMKSCMLMKAVSRSVSSPCPTNTMTTNIVVIGCQHSNQYWERCSKGMHIKRFKTFSNKFVWTVFEY